MKKIAFTTLGCRYNRLESDEMAHELSRAGYERSIEDQAADVVVINTCAVTGKSAARCRAAIREARSKNPKAQVVVTGCYSETSPADVAAVDGVDLVLGNPEKFTVAQALARLSDKPEDGALVLADHGPMPEKLTVRPITGMSGRTNSYLNVQSGCDEVCSFCVVRIARGKSRGAPADELVEQVARLSEAGIKEVVLSGINIGQYKDGAYDLAALVELMLEKTKVARIRLSSINPNDVTERLIKLMATEPRFCRHLHIPLQNGSDKILALMRRPYTTAMYEELIDRLNERVEGIGIGADVMTGFPGETEEDFEHTRSLIERLSLMMLHVFTYSPRKGTEAFGLAGAVDPTAAKARTSLLKQLSSQKRRAFMQGHCGQRLDVLVENSRGKDGRLKGFSSNYIPMVFDGPESAFNTIVAVEAVEVGAGHLEGRMITGQG